MENKSVLVTGGAGYIGSHTVLALQEAGYFPVIIDNLNTGIREHIPEGVPFIHGDAANVETVLNVLKQYDCKSVIHFAGSTVVPESVTEPLKYYYNNTATSRSLLSACIAADVKHFIFSSTAAIYGDPETLPVTEDMTPNPKTPYGTSKLMTEMMLKDVSNAHDLQWTALRYFNVAGADPKGRTGQSTPNATHLIKVACEAASGKRDVFTIFGDDYDTPDGTCIRDFIHVSDLASAHVAALKYQEAGGENGIFNCGYGRGFSIYDVIHSLEKITGEKLSVVVGPRREGDIIDIYADTSKLRNAFNWVQFLHF